MQNYRKYKNDSQNYQLRGISLVAKKTVALLLPDLESDIQSDYFEIDDLRIFRKNFPEKHIGTKWRKTGLPAKDDPGIILSESLVKFIQDKNYPASFMLEEDKIEFFGIDCVTKSSYLLVHQKLNVYYKPNGNPIGKTLGKFIQKPSGDEYLFDNVENKKLKIVGGSTHCRICSRTNLKKLPNKIGHFNVRDGTNRGKFLLPTIFCPPKRNFKLFWFDRNYD